MRIEQVENKEIKIFFEKINNSSKMILKWSTSIKHNEKLNERFKRWIERRRMNESWRKELKKIKTCRILIDWRKNELLTADSLI
jgi:hypothetical protein